MWQSYVHNWEFCLVGLDQVLYLSWPRLGGIKYREGYISSLHAHRCNAKGETYWFTASSAEL